MPQIDNVVGCRRIISSFSGANEFLSNFAPCDITIEGLKFNTLEAAFQASKTHNLKDRTMIAHAPTPGIAKRFGRRIHLRDDWEQVKDSIMLGLLRQKFAEGTQYGKLLDCTGHAILVEGTSWHDQYWGICKCAQHAGTGRNILGQLLMLIRDERRGETEMSTIWRDVRNDWLIGGPYKSSHP